MTASSRAFDVAEIGDAGKCGLGGGAARCMKFGRVEVSEPHFDPSILTNAGRDTEAIAVSDVDDATAESPTRLCDLRHRT